MQNFNFSVKKQFDGKTLQEFLKGQIKLSDSIIKTVKYGGLQINGEFTITTTRVKTGDLVTVTLPKEQPNEYITPLFTPLSVLYEDEYLIAINKPKGMLTHNSKGENNFSLENALAGYFAPNLFVFRAINRLDKDTSGIILVAKDMITASFLSEQIKRGEFIKKYKALVLGVPDKKTGFIVAPIKRETEGNIKRIVSDDGQEAKTKYKLERVLDNNLSILSYQLFTGRTHQIRVHSAYIGCPLYADKLYGSAVNGETFNLCAYFLQFTHPFTKKVISLQINTQF